MITKSIRYYLCSSPYNEVAIIEALRLSSVDTTEIKKHVDKAVTNGDDPTYYDRLYGLAMNYKRMLDELRADKKSSPQRPSFTTKKPAHENEQLRLTGQMCRAARSFRSYGKNA